MKKTGALALLAGVLFLATVGFDYHRESVAVDSCLESGGSFDYSRQACDHAHNHVFVAYSTRHPAAPLLVVVGGVLTTVGVGLVLIRAARRRPI